jgi:hypothetical protein
VLHTKTVWLDPEEVQSGGWEDAEAVRYPPCMEGSKHHLLNQYHQHDHLYHQYLEYHQCFQIVTWHVKSPPFPPPCAVVPLSGPYAASQGGDSVGGGRTGVRA